MAPDVVVRKLAYLRALLEDLETHAGVSAEALADLIPADVSTRLEGAAGMRNILVHLYEQIDYEIVTEGVANALKDFPRLIAALERYGQADR